MKGRVAVVVVEIREIDRVLVARVYEECEV